MNIQWLDELTTLMKNSPYSLALLGSLLLVFSTAALADNDKPKRPEEAKREMLSRHETIAEFQGLEFHLCRGRTARCPEECGDSGEFAQVTVKSGQRRVENASQVLYEAR